MDLISMLRALPWLLLLLLMAPIGATQEAAKEETNGDIAVPDPVALDANWWDYFSQAGDSLEQRIKDFEARLEAIDAQLDGDGDNQRAVRSTLEELTTFTGRYLELVSREPPTPAPQPATKDKYSIVELLELSAEAREATFEAELEREETKRIERSVDIAEKYINDAKAKYLALPQAAPTRLAEGLRIMRARFLNEITALALDGKRRELKLLEARAEFLSNALDRATQSLAVGDTSASEWAGRARSAAQTKERLETEAARVRLRVSGFGASTDERAKRRRSEQRLIEFEVRIASAAVKAAQARLAEQLAAQVHAPSDQRLDVVRAERDALKRLSVETQEALEGWRRATDRERTAAMAQLADVAGMDAQLADLHRARVVGADEASQQVNQLERQLTSALTLVEAAGAYVVEEGGITADLWSRSVQAVNDSWTWVTTWGSTSLFSIDQTPVTAAGLLRVGFILFVAWWLSRILRHALERFMQRRDTMSRASLYTLGRLSHYVILVIATMIALSSIGIDFTKLALFVSALGVGLGFGLQAIFSNFVAGLIILFEKSLKVGDFVELESGVHGEVREINIRGTLITTNDNIDILVPNSEFVSGRVTNWTLREAHRRIRISFGVAYGTDKDLVKQAGLEAADEVPYTLKSSAGRQPQVWLVGFGDSSLDFELVVWLTPEAVKRPATVIAAYNWAIESALGRHGIEIPFPQRDLHVRSYFGHKDEEGLGVVRALKGASDDTLPATAG